MSIPSQLSAVRDAALRQIEARMRVVEVIRAPRRGMVFRDVLLDFFSSSDRDDVTVSAPACGHPQLGETQ
jgi:hypothetical protein